ncbi:hypothetical protein LTR84_003019 [Exophiala bonariae]|uniref:Uncharacterized protein n=1 Tax=Exophiala bonariae TaxID=1690606 RepID=A0AAV9N7V1_9EURO|nr:hypothetical protein LTR84_003019 [Exophiala bonariae]
MFPVNLQGYSDLRRVHFAKPDIEDSEAFDGVQYEPHQQGHHRWWLGYGLFILLGVSILVNGMQYVKKLLDASKHTPHDIDDLCSMYTFEYPSPIQQDIKVKYRTTKFNDTFLEQSRYRGSPGPETDRLWLELGTRNRHYIVPEDKGHKYGLNPGHAKIDP